MSDMTASGRPLSREINGTAFVLSMIICFDENALDDRTLIATSNLEAFSVLSPPYANFSTDIYSSHPQTNQILHKTTT